MTEATTAVAVEQATPAIEAQKPETDIEVSDLDQIESLDGDGADLEGAETEGEGEAGEGTEQAPELVEIEFNGAKHKIPAALKDSFLMHADYTRKTQAVAESSKAVEARMAEAEAAFNVSQEVLQGRAVLINLDSQLGQYENVNWDQLEQDDPLGAQSHWRRFQTLREQRGQVAHYLDNEQAKRNETVQQDTAKRLRETREFAEKSISGWTQDLDNKITEFATNTLGYTREQLLGSYTPAVYNTLYLAYLGGQTLAKQQAPKPKSTQPAQPLKPVTPTGNPSARKDVSEMSMDEYAAFRNRQEAQRRAKR